MVEIFISICNPLTAQPQDTKKKKEYEVEKWHQENYIIILVA